MSALTFMLPFVVQSFNDAIPSDLVRDLKGNAPLLSKSVVPEDRSRRICILVSVDNHDNWERKCTHLENQLVSTNGKLGLQI
jgi:hypothetical protein